jgi:hypothetical protein
MKIFHYRKEEITQVDVDVDQLIKKLMAKDAIDKSPVTRLKDVGEIKGLKIGMTIHKHIANSLFQAHLIKAHPLEEIFFESSLESD